MMIIVKIASVRRTRTAGCTLGSMDEHCSCTLYSSKVWWFTYFFQAEVPGYLPVYRAGPTISGSSVVWTIWGWVRPVTVENNSSTWSPTVMSTTNWHSVMMIRRPRSSPDLPHLASPYNYKQKSPCWRTKLYMEVRRDTWVLWFLSPIYQALGHCVLPAPVVCRWFSDSVRLSTVGCRAFNSRLPVHESGTLCHRRQRQPSRCLCSVSVWSRTSSDDPIQTSTSDVLYYLTAFC